jgi:hypothetical protein
VEPGFFAQELDEEAEALIQIQFLEQLLASRGLTNEGGGDQIREHFRI